MTPERANWWATLPMEERKVRELIRLVKSNIESAKFMLNYCHINEPARANRLKTIRVHKLMLSALKKRIAVRPVTQEVMYETDFGLKRGKLVLCPTCKAQVEPKGLNFHCYLCGQRLE